MRVVRQACARGVIGMLDLTSTVRAPIGWEDE